jgi:hypothetical protein
MYELGIYIQEDGILHSHSRDNLKSNIIPVFGAEMYSERLGFARNAEFTAKAPRALTEVPKVRFRQCLQKLHKLWQKYVTVHCFEGNIE